MSTLIIVESPTKVKTIQKYLGNGYRVMASTGHIRDLPKSLLGVDIENGFQPRYVDIPGKSAIIRQLKQAAAESDNVLLATDPDREGEAISWHLACLLGIDTAEKARISFNEITKTGITRGLRDPRPLDMNLVNAQQARRILDRIVGYKISPFLWKKIRKGLSAGRVQSAAVRMLVDREEEIRAFRPEEYWTVDVQLAHEDSKPFSAKFYGGKKGKLPITCAEQAQRILSAVREASFVVEKIKRGTRRLQPAPPFITSTLQQDANRRLGFTAKRTMQTAQQLYEGVEISGIGATGLITYMRTDSLRISQEARDAGNAYIKEKFGKKYLPEKPRYYKSRANAQDAHEAIRPTDPYLTPERVKPSLSSDQYKLYRLIWARFIASLMAPCEQDTVQADIRAGEYLFRASGYSIKFDGYTAVYSEAKDGGTKEEEDEANTVLPPLREGDMLRLCDSAANQHFTQPPARYTEATLVKAFEEKGIGRPSTYAPTVNTILTRGYVERDGKALKPTALGEVTTQLMKEYFPQIVDIAFTAQMEEGLDEVESGKTDWVEELSAFYKDFSQTLEKADQSLSGERIRVPDEESDVVCELCGRKMVIKTGKYGKFLACPGYPECKNTKPFVEFAKGTCPKCSGAIVIKKSKRGRKFYGCQNYPDCDFVTWLEPTAKICPLCGKTLFRQKGKGAGYACLSDACGYRGDGK